MSYILHVGNIPWGTSQEELKKEFLDFGEVLQIKLIKDWSTKDSKGYAFVEMASEQDALDAIEDLDGSIFGGCRLRVSKASRKRSQAYTEKPTTQKERSLQEDSEDISFSPVKKRDPMHVDRRRFYEKK
jgi:RNA recognition motif-containing protein